MSRSVVVALACAVVCALSPTAGPAQPLIDGSLFDFHPRPATPQPSLVFTYRGWRVDASKARRAQAPAQTVRAIDAQIDTVERMGLKPDLLAFMRTVPIAADPTRGNDAESYVAGQIRLRVRRLDAKRPSLLYALLQAYYGQRLAGQAPDRDLDAFRRQIVERRVWPKAALMLQNNQQFFALTATAYLYGDITREPYTRADLKKTEPQYAQWLATLFDGGKPRP